jgi:biopolymer transport protein ExbD
MHNKISPAKLNRLNTHINVAPLVDVVLVLLIVFMVLVPLLERDMAVQIPEDSFLAETPEGQLLVSLDKTGHLYLNQERIADGDYVNSLQKALAAQNSHAERVVFFSVDGQASYEKAVFALEGARQAGAVALGLLVASPSASPSAPK